MSTTQVYKWQPTPSKILDEETPVKMGQSLSQNLSSPIVGEDLMGLSWLFIEDEF